MKIFSDFLRTLKIGLIIILLINSCSDKKDDNIFYFPADFDPVNSTCFVWSNEYFEIIPKLVGIISAKDKVTVFWDEKSADNATIHKILENYQSNFENINLVKVRNKPNSNWIRDFGPVYLVNNTGEKKIIDFGYFGKQLEFNKEISEKMNLPLVQSSFNSSGGSRDTNGKGTLILCEAHELDVNKLKTKMQIEKEYKEKLAIKKFVWMKRGLPQDDSRLNGPLFEQIYPNGVNGHIDQFCRFANAETILISSVTDAEAKLHPILAEAKKRLDENYKILINSTDQDGKKFKIIKVPIAPLFFIERNLDSNKIFVTPVTSYMNFIISNSMIILPSYTSAQMNNELLQSKEKEVEKIFKSVFPTREIIKVQAADLNSFSGGFHCISINEPLVKNN